MSITLCAPRSAEAFSQSVIAPLNLNACVAYSHVSLSLTLSITVIDVNEPPVFDVAHLNLTAPGVGTVNQSIGFPLSRLASDPDTTPPFNTLIYTLNSGSCEAIVALALPVAIVSADGQLFYNVSGPLNAWPNPLLMCVTVTNGGMLNASVDVSLRFTDVDMQLSVFPTALNVTHCSFGTSAHNVYVIFYAGTHVNESWTVAAVSVPWLAAVRVSTSTLSLTANSTSLSLSQEARVGAVTLKTTGMSLALVLCDECPVIATLDAGGTLTTSITLALLISIPVAVIEPGFILQSLRAGSKACM